MSKEPLVDVYEVQPHELMVGLVEVIRETQKNIGYFEMKEMTKDHLDKNAKKIIERKAKTLSEVEITALASKLYTKLMMRGTIQALEALATYQAEANGMSKQQFLREEHDAKRLSRHMKAAGIQRPRNTALMLLLAVLIQKLSRLDKYSLNFR
ncbi:hypothetical protein [Aliikangiella sp. IMCC44359]|uniref:hypothetical protein n=1 Tax=Aliikangiella sp. IMCC44359 TaxID=3459125 RepID=UPI00403B25CB